MEVFVKKTKLDESTSGREPGLKCLLYEAWNNPQVSHVEQQNLKAALNKIGPNMSHRQGMVGPADHSEWRSPYPKYYQYKAG